MEWWFVENLDGDHFEELLMDGKTKRRESLYEVGEAHRVRR
jgi:hypothetical protein